MDVTLYHFRDGEGRRGAQAGGARGGAAPRRAEGCDRQSAAVEEPRVVARVFNDSPLEAFQRGRLLGGGGVDPRVDQLEGGGGAQDVRRAGRRERIGRRWRGGVRRRRHLFALEQRAAGRRAGGQRVAAARVSAEAQPRGNAWRRHAQDVGVAAALVRDRRRHLQLVRDARDCRARRRPSGQSAALNGAHRASGSRPRLLRGGPGQPGDQAVSLRSAQSAAR
mmetsp:Transcript_30282/g.69460  ORF Transcript_30282/g.69460 Transcript_30282/m.69460 type:complete len:222 (+) Transcript_30282:966-1631(+)